MRSMIGNAFRLIAAEAKRRGHFIEKRRILWNR